MEGSTKIRSDRATNLVFGHKERWKQINRWLPYTRENLVLQPVDFAWNIWSLKPFISFSISPRNVSSIQVFFLIWCYFTCILRNKTRNERKNFTLNPAPMITWSWEKKQNNNLLTIQSGYQLFFVYSLHDLLYEYSSPGAQGKSNMAGYGKQILVRDVFLWSISAIYLFAFSSLYIQIPGRL